MVIPGASHPFLHCYLKRTSFVFLWQSNGRKEFSRWTLGSWKWGVSWVWWYFKNSRLLLLLYIFTLFDSQTELTRLAIAEHRIFQGLRILACLWLRQLAFQSHVKSHTKAGLARLAALQVLWCLHSLWEDVSFLKLTRTDCIIVKLDVSTKGIQWQTWTEWKWRAKID